MERGGKTTYTFDSVGDVPDNHGKLVKVGIFIANELNTLNCLLREFLRKK